MWCKDETKVSRLKIFQRHLSWSRVFLFCSGLFLFFLSISNPCVHRRNFKQRFCIFVVFFFRYLLNIPGPLDIPARLCKGNFDDEMFNYQVPYLWLIYWWDIIYCGEIYCILDLHLLLTTELHCIKTNLMF